MKLLDMKLVREGRFLKNYELTYENKEGREKVFEMVSHSRMEAASQLGKRVSGMSIVVKHEGRLLLLKEFRMAVNSYVYNLCAGMIEAGETIEQAIERELYEETGLHVKKIVTILRPSYAAVGLSDIKNCIAFVEAEGVIADHTSVNEDIKAGFYTKKEALELLLNEDFSSRAQIITYMFTLGAI